MKQPCQHVRQMCEMEVRKLGNCVKSGVHGFYRHGLRNCKSKKFSIAFLLERCEKLPLCFSNILRFVHEEK